MVTDYEAAWVELMAHVASKTQHGREGLLSKMAELAAEHRVAAGELSSVLRLYGVEVGRSRAASAEPRDTGADFVSGLRSLADDARPAHHRPGGHDGDAGSAGEAGREGERDGRRRRGDAGRVAGAAARA